MMVSRQAPFEGVAEDCPATPNRAAPLLIEFVFADPLYPTDYGLMDDRPLTVGFILLELRSEDRAMRIDFRADSYDGLDVLYGLATREIWGVWGTGCRTAFLLDPGFPVEAGARLHLDYAKIAFGRPMMARVFLNGQRAPDIRFDGDSLEIEIEERHTMKVAGRRADNLSLAVSARPSLSVIMVSFNRPDLVLASIVTLLARAPSVPLELILVENGTAVDRRCNLERFGIPVRRIDLARAVSFGEANNLAVEQARADALLFINNDAFVQDDCLSKLFAALMAPSDVAAVGPVFHYPDGRLQEAGGYLTPNGILRVNEDSRFGGRTGVASDADYISAACLMMRRQDFDAAGGFDPVFEPAYYEDADLCLRLRRWHGRRIRLLPHAMVVHIGNATSSDLKQEVSLSAADAFNRENFLTRWRFDAVDPAEKPFPAWHAETRVDAASAEIAVLCDHNVKPAGERAAFLAASLFSDVAPTIMVGSQPRSGFRAAHVLREYERDKRAFAIADIGDVAGHSFQCAVTVTERFPPDFGPFENIPARRRVLYAPAFEIGAAPEGLHALAQFDAIVTSSEMAAEHVRAQLRNWGMQAIPVAVLREPVAPLPGEPMKDNLVAVSGDLRAIDVAALLNRFRNDAPQPWQGIVLAEISLGFDASEIGRLRHHCERSRLGLSVNPQMATLRLALQRAKLFVSVAGNSLPRADHASLHAVRQTAIAIAAGCIPVVRSGTAGAELCDELQCGIRYDALTDLDSCLVAAAGLDAPHRGGAAAAPLLPHAIRGSWMRVAGLEEGGVMHIAASDEAD